MCVSTIIPVTSGPEGSLGGGPGGGQGGVPGGGLGGGLGRGVSSAGGIKLGVLEQSCHYSIQCMWQCILSVQMC